MSRDPFETRPRTASSANADTRSAPMSWSVRRSTACRSGGKTLVGFLETPEANRDPLDRERLLHRQALAMATAGHDLKQPLQVIAMAFERVRRREVSESERMWLDIAKGEIGRLSSGLDELALMAVAGEADVQPPLRGTVVVNDVLHALVGKWEHHAAARSLRLSCVTTSLTVTSNPRLLGVILDNLISNAIKYTARGGVVVGCRRRGSGCAIEVVDSGRGFNVGEDTAFRPFWREEDETEGLGLGLSIVRQTANLLDHAIQVRSVRGCGSSVAVLFDEGGRRTPAR